MAPDLAMERAEQSDMVMFLLNLAYVPDSVIRQLPSFEHGWQKKLKQLMDQEQAEFSQKYYKWRPQDE